MLLAMMRLGFWQLDRLQEKRSHNAAILTALNQPSEALPDTIVDPDSLDFRHVRVMGIYDHAQSIVWRNQTLDNRNGMHLLTPLRIHGSDYAVLIDRGWLPEEQARPEQRSAYNGASSEVTIEGIARHTQSRPNTLLAPMDLALPGETRIDAWMRVDIERIQRQVPYPLLPIFIQQLPLPGTDPSSLPRADRSLQLDEGPHLSYALQWFTFSSMLVVIYAVLIRQELR